MSLELNINRTFCKQIPLFPNILPDEKLQALKCAVNTQLSHIATSEQCPTQLNDWKKELEELTFYRAQVFLYKVIDLAAKIFGLSHQKFEVALEMSSLASRLVKNYSDLVTPSAIHYPKFEEGNSSHEKELLKLSRFRLILIQKLVSEFKISLIEKNTPKSLSQFEKLPHWLKKVFVEMIHSTQGHNNAPLQEQLKRLIEPQTGSLPLLDQFLETLDLQILSYVQLIYSGDLVDRKPFINSIKQNDQMIDCLSHHSLSDDDATFDATIDRLLEKIPGRVANEPIRVTMVGVEYAGLFKEGGLGEAIEGISRGVLALNPENQVSLIFPKYSHLPRHVLEVTLPPSLVQS